MDSRFSDNTASGFDYLYLAHLSQLNDHSSLHYFSSVKIWIKRSSHKCPTVIQHTFQLPFLSRIAESKKFYNMKRGKKISKRSDPFTPTKQKQRIYLFNWIHCVSHFLLLDKPTFLLQPMKQKIVILTSCTGMTLRLCHFANQAQISPRIGPQIIAENSGCCSIHIILRLNCSWYLRRLHLQVN